MIAMDTQIQGMAELNAVMQKAALKLEHPKPMFNEVSHTIKGDLELLLSRGMDPDGNPLPATEQWTRFVQPGIQGRKGRAIPLNNTGGFRRAMNIWGLSDYGAEIGWKGPMLKRAIAMKIGKAGRMKVSEKRIPKRYSGVRAARKTGRTYARIRMSQGWRTKRVFGNQIAIKPKARNFFYLSRNHIQKAARIADRYVRKAIDG